MKNGFQSISLSGTWELAWTEVGTGSIETAPALFLGDTCIPCKVPGDVHDDLAKAGIIAEPLLDINSEDCRWLERKEFWYRKRFRVGEDFLGDRVELVLEGLDLTADLWLNGVYLGSHNNAFIEKHVDVTDCLKAGENQLTVRIDDGVHGVQDKPLDFTKYAWNNEQPCRVWMRKPQFVYGWDWTIWMPTCGIWRDVSLRSCRKAAIGDVHIQGSGAQLDTWVEISFLRPGAYRLSCRVLGDDRFGSGEEAASACLTLGVQEPGESGFRLPVRLEDPKLWWPNGSGDPYLYTVEIRLEDEEGRELQTVYKRHGLRTVEIREDAVEGGKSFTFTVNGQRIFCKGANHVPADCLPGRVPAEKSRKLLQMAADAHMNMIRVWGGGVYESDGFMDTCDELGLMVWHDFMFACGFYPDHDPDFYEEIRVEATAAIKRLRSHPSLVGWSGNNEIQEMYGSVKRWHPEQSWRGGRIYDELLPELVEALCPDRIYRPSSPYGGATPDDYNEGDQHTWHFTHRPGWEHYLDLWRFTDFDFKFLSEFGIIGAMNLSSARKCIRQEALRPDSAEWKHHTNTSQDHSLLDTFVDVYFGSHEGLSLQAYTLKSQVVQAEIMRHIYDELRTRKFRCSGVLLWTLSDSYGIHNWSVIDYYLAKRPVYSYLKRSMAPVNLSFRGYEVQCFDGMAGYRDYWQGKPEPVTLHLANDTLEEKQVEVAWQVVTFDGQVLLERTEICAVPANGVTQAASVDVSTLGEGFRPEETVLWARVLENGVTVNENHYFFAPYGKLRLRSASVGWKAEGGKLRLEADTFVWMLHVEEEGICLEDNDFILLPGQARTVAIRGEWPEGHVPQLHCLNDEWGK